MKKRKIFNKNKSNKKYYISLIVLFFFFMSLFSLYILTYQHEFFVINENIKKFYIIPKDKKGKTVPNTNIRILDYNNNLNQASEVNNMNNLFSIQLYASSDYDSILSKLTYFENNLSFIKEDLSVVGLKHNLGIDYLLVYKSFINKIEAIDYCSKYLNFIKNCLIVNIRNLN